MRHYKYTRPTTDQMLEFARAGRVFASYDLRNAFMHIVLHKDSRLITGFRAPAGYFVMNRLPFGKSIDMNK